MRPTVRFEVRTLGVDFVATREIATVDSSLLQRVRRLGGERMLAGRMDNNGRVVAPRRTHMGKKRTLEI